MDDRSLWLGELRVDILRDGVFDMGREALTHGAGQAALARTLDVWGGRPLRIDVNCFLLRGPRGTELVDAGTGPSWGPGLGHARAALEQAGVTPDAVDRVFLTHIHGDHALGLLDGAAAWFPRAEVIVPDGDLGFFTDTAARARVPEARRAGFDIATKLTAAYGERLRAVARGPVAAGVDLVPLPGHTPGQGGYLLREGASPLLLWGDALHLADLQAPDPDVGLVYDLDGATAAATRRAILARAADEGWTVGGGHLAGFGRVARADDGFRIVPL